MREERKKIRVKEGQLEGELKRMETSELLVPSTEAGTEGERMDQGSDSGFLLLILLHCSSAGEGMMESREGGRSEAYQRSTSDSSLMVLR